MKTTSLSAHQGWFQPFARKKVTLAACRPNLVEISAKDVAAFLLSFGFLFDSMILYLVHTLAFLIAAFRKKTSLEGWLAGCLSCSTREVFQMLVLLYCIPFIPSTITPFLPDQMICIVLNCSSFWFPILTFQGNASHRERERDSGFSES